MIQQATGFTGNQSTGSTNLTRAQPLTESTPDNDHALTLYILKFPQDTICVDLQTYQSLYEALKSESKTTEEEESATLESSPDERFLLFKNGQNPHDLIPLAKLKESFKKYNPQSVTTLFVSENIFTKLFTELFPHRSASNYHLVGFLHVHTGGSMELESRMKAESTAYNQSRLQA
jgi:hypothetical protein